MTGLAVPPITRQSRNQNEILRVLRPSQTSTQSPRNASVISLLELLWPRRAPRYR